MSPASFRRWISAFGALVALTTAIVPPIGYAVIAYFAQANAQRVAERVPDIAAVSFLLSVVIFFAFRWLPLRLLDQTFSRLKQKETEFSDQNIRFEAALENMPHALCMFDGEQRLVVCNSNFSRLYGLSPEDTRPGTTLQAILQRRIAAGNCPEDVDGYLESRTSRDAMKQALGFVDRLRDGRFISVTRKPMATGGWVSIHQDITEQKKTEDKIAYMAHHDALTGLPNRMFLREELSRHLAAIKRGGAVAVLCLDLDEFKQVNDTLGHPVGDSLLRAVTERLRECVGEHDVVARLGGDEFAVIQTAADQPTGATALAQRLVECIAQSFQAEGHEIVVTTSIGIAVAPDDGNDPDQLLKSADVALYRAKEQGRNGFCFFEAGMDAKMQERRALETDLRRAIAAGEFELFYQPVINLEENVVTSFEALLRWRHPTRGLIAPADFIPLAEETALIIPIGEWVLRRACRDAATWPTDIKVAINLSPVQFRSKSLVASIMLAIASAGIAPSRVELEITETILLQNSEATLAVLHQLRALGVRVAMDDFGTGYSSLSYLRSFPFDKIKIDRSFVRDLERNQDALAIIRAVSGLGLNLGMVTTVEGVETKEQLDQIRAELCTEAQGYLFSTPQPAHEIPRLLSTLGKAKKAAA